MWSFRATQAPAAFHAQPVCCRVCGPRLSLVYASPRRWGNRRKGRLRCAGAHGHARLARRISRVRGWP
ncbi:hypothetical protein [Streptomyces sp. NPDC056949]|uniref:hypothetical protein n=1 Tax=Streptomyces sp. NPDC056949 TaxID=3345976 RepID=UPI0036315B5D